MFRVDVRRDRRSPASATSAPGCDGLMHSALSTIGLARRARSPARASSRASSRASRQVGFRPTPQALKPDFRRINPASGLKNLLGPNAVFEALKAIVKVAVVGAVAALALLPGLTGLAAERRHLRRLRSARCPGARRSASPSTPPSPTCSIGVVDYAWKRHRHEKQLKMTKQEVKDEAASTASPPRSRLRCAAARCRPRARA